MKSAAVMSFAPVGFAARVFVDLPGLIFLVWKRDFP